MSRPRADTEMEPSWPFSHVSNYQALCPQAWEGHMNHKTRARQGEEYLYCVAWDYDTVIGALAPNQVHDTIGKVFPDKEVQPASQLPGRSVQSHTQN